MNSDNALVPVGTVLAKMLTRKSYDALCPWSERLEASTSPTFCDYGRSRMTAEVCTFNNSIACDLPSTTIPLPQHSGIVARVNGQKRLMS